MRDFKKQFDELQEKYNDKKIKHAKAEEKFENYLKEEKQINEGLKELGVSKEDAGNVLETLEEEIKEELEKCEKTLG